LKNPSFVLKAAFLLPLATSFAIAQTPAAAPVKKAPAAPSSTQAPAAAAQMPTITLLPPDNDPLPPFDPKFITAASPTPDTVTSFLTHIWGDDSNRLWRIMGIQNTQEPGVSQVIVAIAQKASTERPQIISFYVLPDGKFAIGGGSGLVPFGANPFAHARDLLKEKADGPARGSASKDLLLVEFSDLQCPHCKEVQPTVDKILKDFPKARIVFQPLPLTEIHPSAFKAAAFGVCAQKQSDAAFFKFVDGVFETQEGLTPATEDTILKAAAMRAGLDGAAIAECANTKAVKDIVNADIKLADDAGVGKSTPTLSVNGRIIPFGIPYDSLKRVIVFQAKLDGVETGASADILAPEPTAAPVPTSAAPTAAPAPSAQKK
jgi:protein-disulfide isomerase